MKRIGLFTLIASALITLVVACNIEKEGVVLKYPQKKNMRFCYIGDTGTGKSEQRMVGKSLATEGCDYVVILGDIVYPNGIDSADDPQLVKKFEKPYREIFNNSSTKFIWAAGNHDNRGNLDALKEYASTRDNVIFPRQFFQMRFGGLCLNVLDTNFNFKEQIEFFEPRFEKCDYNMVASHHPYVSSGEHGDAKFFIKSFLEELVIGKTDIFFAGHDHHLSDEGSIEGTRQLISGAGGKLRDLDSYPEVWGKSTFGYAVLDIDTETYELETQFVEVTEKGAKVLHEFRL